MRQRQPIRLPAQRAVKQAAKATLTNRQSQHPRETSPAMPSPSFNCQSSGTLTAAASARACTPTFSYRTARGRTTTCATPWRRRYAVGTCGHRIAASFVLTVRMRPCGCSRGQIEALQPAVPPPPTDLHRIFIRQLPVCGFRVFPEPTDTPAVYVSFRHQTASVRALTRFRAPRDVDRYIPPIAEPVMPALHSLPTVPHECPGASCEHHGRLAQVRRRVAAGGPPFMWLTLTLMPCATQGVLPLVAIEHIELQVEEDDSIDFWDPKGTFWDTRKTLFSNMHSAWESNKNWTPAEGGIKNAGTIGTFARCVPLCTRCCGATGITATRCAAGMPSKTRS